MREPKELIEFLQPYPAHVREFALAGRLFLLEKLWPVTEIYYDAVQAVCSGFTYTGEVRDNFVNLAVYSNHVTLIFPFGAELSDPDGRLKGNGTRVRNLRLSGMETLHDPYILELIRQSSEIAPRPLDPVEPGVVVKVMKGNKKRPVATRG